MTRSFAVRSAFTLVEILVTMMVMLIMVLAMSQMFALVGRHVTDGRALIELQGQLRNASYRVQEDLDGLTIVARHAPDLDWEVGYFEYLEGEDRDGVAPFTFGSDRNPTNAWFVDASGNPAAIPADGTHTAYGDIDDVLMFTARSRGRPFLGRIQGSLVGGSGTVAIESQDAEIIYWTQWTDADGDGQIDLGEVSLHRRVLLIRPDLTQFLHANPALRTQPANMPAWTTLAPADLANFYNNNDLSVHLEVATVAGNQVVRLTPNSLADLAKRENRVAHLRQTNPAASNFTTSSFPLIRHYPNFFDRAWLPAHFGARAGEDIVLTDLLAFDVRAFDPTAQLWQGGAAGAPFGDLLAPGDFGWDTAANAVGQGAYVDLGYRSGYTPTPPASRNSAFSGAPAARSGLGGGGNRPIVPTYDTWTWAYEHDGINQQLAGVTYAVMNVTDEATNGIDDDNANGVDDAGERETLPPYSTPLRGIQISLRAIELDTRQIRQVSVVAEFAPQ